MGCTSSKYIPWAGRNHVTQAAKVRKKAAKETLEAFKVLSNSHATRLGNLRIFTQNLALFLEDEDKALYSGDIPQISVSTSTDGTPYQASWVSNPNTLADPTPAKSEDFSEVTSAEKAVPSAPQATADAEASDLKPLTSSEVTTVAIHNPSQSSQALALVTYAGHSGVSGALTVAEGSRGVGLKNLGAILNDLTNEIHRASHPATDVLALSPPKKYAALPPVPGYATGGIPGSTSDKLWDVLEILVAYERARSKETKASEKAKWELARTSKKLSKQSGKQVKPEKAQKHEKRLANTHSQVQTTQASITRFQSNIENYSRTIETIKYNMVLPALQKTLAGLLQQHLNVSTIYDKQRQAVNQLTENGKLTGRHVAGSGVLLTQPSHNSDTKGLETALTKLDDSFQNYFIAEKKFLSSVLNWLDKVEPIAAVPPPNPYPPNNPQGVAPQESVQQFLDGTVSAGDPLFAFSTDWLRALDKLPYQSVKDSIYLYRSWVKEALLRQAEELKQVKSVKDAQHSVEKFSKKLEHVVTKEKQLRASLSINPSGSGSAPGDSTESLPETISPASKHEARAIAKEQKKEVKAFELAKTVGLEKAMLESAKNKVTEEQQSLEAMALTARVTATNGLEQGLPQIFQSFASYSAVASQMYGMLQYQHARGFVQLIQGAVA